MTSARRATPWQLLRERPRTDGWIPVVSRTYRMPDGAATDWDVHIGRDSVSVLALTPAQDVVLVREFRPGPGSVVVNLPGGLLDEGEDPVTAGGRELREETGYRAARVEPAGWSWAFSTSTWKQHAVVAYDCEKVGEPTSWGGEEWCEPVVVPLRELRAGLRTGAVQVGPTYLALDAAGLL